MKITADTRFSEMCAMDGFGDIMEVLLHKMRWLPVDELTPNTFAGSVSPAWNGEAIAYGINRLRELQQAGVPVVQQVYTQAEIEKEPDKGDVSLLWFPAKKKGPFALVCAGGSYQLVATIVEGAPVAARLNELDVSAFCLEYRVGEYPAVERAREDMHAAIRFILKNAEQFNVEPSYCAIGFSAGGHLVSTLGMSNMGWRSAGLPKPQMLALAYALVNIGSDLPSDILSRMLGDGYDASEAEKYSAVYHLDDYPPAYIWNTVDDEAVSYSDNAEKMAKLLAQKELPYFLKRVEHGEHGLGLGLGSEAEGWLEEAVRFWREKTLFTV